MIVCERRRTELYAKQGRKNQFETAEARDRWITEVLNAGYFCLCLYVCLCSCVIGVTPCVHTLHYLYILGYPPHLFKHFSTPLRQVLNIEFEQKTICGICMQML